MGRPFESSAVEIGHLASAYPRFRYFQENLVNLTPRFQRIIEAAKLYSSISQGRSKFDRILTDAKDFSNKYLSVTVLCDDVEAAELVHEEMKFDKTVEKDEAKSKDKEEVYEKKFDITAEKDEAKSKDKEEVYEKKFDKTVEKDEAKSKDKEEVPEKKILSWNQFLEKTKRTLNQASVIVFAFNSSAMVEKEVLKTMFSQLHVSVNTACVVYDIRAKVNYSLSELEGVGFDINQLHLTPFNSSLSDHVQFLLEEKVVRMLEDILQFVRNFTPKMKQELEIPLLDHIFNEIMKSLTDDNTLEDLSPVPKYIDVSKASSSDSTEEELDEKFHDKLIDYLARKCKCLICDELSKKYGIKASVINDFLNEKQYDFPGKFNKNVRAMSLPKYACLEDPSRRSEFRYFAYSCGSHSKEVIEGAEKYIGRLMFVVGLLERLEFEICSLLRLSKITKNVHVPEIPDLPPKMQKDILKIEGVNGCGTISGKLTIMVNDKVTSALTDEIKSTLRWHNYNYPFHTQSMKMSIRTKSGKSVPDRVENGSCVRADFLNPTDPEKPFSYGSVGCFVNVRNIEEESSTAMEKKKHFLTCAHVFDKTYDSAHVRIGEQYIHIGNKTYEINSPLCLDIATVEVFEGHLGICEKEIKKPCNVQKTDKWTILSKDEECGIYPVYMPKKTGESKHGQIVSFDYMENLHGIPDDPKIDRHYNILIVPVADIKEDFTVFSDENVSDSDTFSQEADSGSIICKQEMDGNNILVIALLCGAIYGKYDKYKYSYGGHLGRNLHCLAESKGLEIEPANGD